MNDFCNIRKVCSFYVSNMHFATMILPYIGRQIEKGIEIATFLEYNLKENIELVLSRIILDEKEKQKIKQINWKENNSYKYSVVEKVLKSINKKESIILVSGRENYIKYTNKNINKYIEKNIKRINNKKIKIINSYEIRDFNENVREILDSHDLVLNTSGEHQISDIFEGYKNNVTY